MSVTYNFETELLVNTTTGGNQFNSDITLLSDGSYLVVWQLDDSPGTAVFGQLYNSDFTPSGAEFVVNATIDPGTFWYAEPRGVALADGGFAVAWTDNQGLAYRSFDSTGTATSGDVYISGVDPFFGSSLDWQIDVAPTSDGGFIVTTMRLFSDGFGAAGTMPFAIFVGGAMDGTEVQLSTTYGSARATQIVELPNGNYVVSWTDAGDGDGDGFSESSGTPFFQIISSTGVLIGSAEMVSGALSEGPAYAQAWDSHGAGQTAVLTDGSFVVTWLEEDSTGVRSVYQRHYASDGTAIDAAAVLVDGDVGRQGSSLAVGLQGGPYATGLSDGGWVVLWYTGDTDNSEVWGQRYEAGGAPDGAAFQVNTYAAGTQYPSSIIAHDDGGFTVLFESDGQDGVGYGIYMVKAEVTAPDETIYGTPEPDVINGTNGDDVIDGLAGDDVINAGDGNDTLHGGAGADTLIGASGNDSYFVDDAGDTVVEAAAEGIDHVTSSVSYRLASNVENLTLTGTAALTGIGNAGSNTLTGNSGNNALNGYGGADTMLGGAGNDSYYVDDAGDQVSENAGEGNDWVYSSIDFTLSSDVENLTLTGTALNGTGNAGSNTVIGNALNNVLNGAGGADMMLGGAGNDTFYVHDAGDRAAEEAGAGSDHVYSSVSFTLWSNVENLTLTGTAALTGIGNTGNNTLTGNSGNNALNGYGGADLMQGGVGNDSFYVSNVGDEVSENAGEGTDWVYSSINFTLSTDVENLTLLGTALTATGNAGINTVIGNAQDNVLDGAGGADMMLGGGGNDTFYVDNAGDRASEEAGGGTDNVYSSVSFTLWANVENLTLTGTAALTGIGNAGSNTLTGNSGSNALNGYGGADTMLGGAGNDSYYVDNAGDQVSENPGEGTDWVYSSVSFTLSTDVENLTLTGSAALDVTANGQNNLIFGNGGANSIAGDGGDDRLYGKGGNDELTGGAGADGFYFDTAPHSGTNSDAIVDFTVAEDTIHLNIMVFTELAAIGALDAGAFHQGTAAADADNRIIYDSATGNIYYDADGDGGGAAVQFAQVSAGTLLSAGDFFAY